MRRRRQHHSRRGIATLLAVIALGLVAAGLTSMALLIRDDIRRTQTVQTDAQLRQLLLAGVSDAVTRSHSWTDVIEPQKWSIALPSAPSLEGASLTGELQSNSPGTADLQIQAVVADRSADEQLVFESYNDEWKLIRVGPPSGVSPTQR